MNWFQDSVLTAIVHVTIKISYYLKHHVYTCILQSYKILYEIINE